MSATVKNAVIGLLTLFSSGLLSAGSHVFPGVGGSPGNAYSLYPFGLELAELPSMRYQQVYAFDFLFPSGGPEYVTQIWFRTDHTQGHGFGLTLRDVQINLSTTQRGPTDLSSVFAENVGGDEMAVLGRGPIDLASPGAGVYVPLALQVPFWFDPAQGNLLMEIRVYDPVAQPEGFDFHIPPFDAEDDPNDEVARVWAADANAAIGQVDTLGLVTLIRTSPVPEPNTWVLGALATLLLLIRRRSHRSKNH